MNINSNTIERVRELTRATIELRELCLHKSAQWAAEQLKGLIECQGYREAQTEGARKAMESMEVNPDFLLARQFFEGREYRRAASALEEVNGEKALFLRTYSLYLAGEKRKEEECIEQYGALDQNQTQNAELEGLESKLREVMRMGARDPFLYYVYGLVLSDRQRKAEARDMLLQSVTLYPCHWGAWQALQALCPSLEVVQSLTLPDHWMHEFFQASVCVELQHAQEGLICLQRISRDFPESRFVTAQAAISHYNLRKFHESQMLFEELLRMDPHRLEGIDTYSNILYVKEMAAELSYLAHKAVMTDKYRPETCCIIGNYFSLKGAHDKALLYFQRALKLDKHYLSAWTLMGHEYVEIKNCAAAIDAYRHAVDLNPKDFRAWYGLGQAYEMMEMPSFALYYFRRAAQLRPTDARMWNAMGICYNSTPISKPDAAIRCFTRALKYGDQEGVSITLLARLYKQSGQRDEAAHYYKMNLDRLDEQNVGGEDVIDALTFLAEHFMNKGDFRQAEVYCSRLMDSGGPAKERAKQMMRDMRNEAHGSLG